MEIVDFLKAPERFVKAGGRPGQIGDQPLAPFKGALNGSFQRVSSGDRTM